MINFDTFADLYKSEWQGTWALLLVPALFLAFLLVSERERDRRRSTAQEMAFLGGWMLFWTLETLLDPLATGPFTRLLSWQNTDAGTGVMLLFVLLGDLRVFQLIFRIGRPEDGFARSLLRAGAWTLLVPIFSYWMDLGLRQIWPTLPGQTLWLTYELSFLAMALFLRNSWIPGRSRSVTPHVQAGLRRIATYVAVYYALWALSDTLILVFGLDAGWLLRTVPNQLYYAFFVPFVWFTLARSR